MPMSCECIKRETQFSSRWAFAAGWFAEGCGSDAVIMFAAAVKHRRTQRDHYSECDATELTKSADLIAA